MRTILFFRDGCYEKICGFICFSSWNRGQVVRESLWLVVKPDQNLVLVFPVGFA